MRSHLPLSAADDTLQRVLRVELRRARLDEAQLST
jgi:hypothetical protein